MDETFDVRHVDRFACGRWALLLIATTIRVDELADWNEDERLDVSSWLKQVDSAGGRVGSSSSSVATTSTKTKISSG